MGSLSARALEFTVLTATRTGEVTLATWQEINLNDKVWIIPAARMKAGREHRVPLSDAAMAVLERVKGKNATWVFPGLIHDEPLSNMAMLMLLKGMGHTETVHGFRSTFTDWASECTSFPGEVIKMAKAHAIEDKTEAAYRRGDLFEKRKKLMDAWAKVRDLSPVRERHSTHFFRFTKGSLTGTTLPTYWPAKSPMGATVALEHGRTSLSDFWRKCGS